VPLWANGRAWLSDEDSITHKRLLSFIGFEIRSRTLLAILWVIKPIIVYEINYLNTLLAEGEVLRSDILQPKGGFKTRSTKVLVGPGSSCGT